MNRNLIFIAGATGYIGGRLLMVLEAKGYRVRCLARHPEYLRPRTGRATQVVAGDVFIPETLDAALGGVDQAYYLVHSMGSAEGFEEQDRIAARNFASAAGRAGVRRIIYLGGLGTGGALSSHLRSRQEVGSILRESGVPVIEFRASIVIGSGSLSFEMIRALVERLPIMITPKWVSVTAQPIAVRDVLDYLAGALELAKAESRIFEIGGNDQVSYRDIMAEYARQRGLRRIMISVPVITPRLSSLWLALITPLYARTGRKLVDSIRNPTIVRDPSALAAFDIRPLGMAAAIAAALRNEDQDFAATRWSDSLSAAGAQPTWAGVRFGNRFVDSRVADVKVPSERVFAVISRLGGATGWYYANWLWRLRGWCDLLVGGWACGAVVATRKSCVLAML